MSNSSITFGCGVLWFTGVGDGGGGDSSRSDGAGVTTSDGGGGVGFRFRGGSSDFGARVRSLGFRRSFPVSGSMFDSLYSR